MIHPDQVRRDARGLRAVGETSSSGRGEVVDAYERAEGEGRGVVALDGEMIDLPVVERARQLLSDEKRSVLHAE